MGEYRVNLEIYNGPLDLLLYLIRRDEVDIHDIPIASITAQYMDYVELLKKLDPNLAGEFLVIAATLMEIKTRMLLPSVVSEEEGAEGLEVDPRADLIRQLLEYKSFKDAAADLRAAREEQAGRFGRQLIEDTNAQGEVALEDAQVWDLLDAFNGLMAAIGADSVTQEIIYDDTPVELHATDIMHRLQTEGPTSFAKIFEGRTARTEIVGLFLALLELIRRKWVLAGQTGNFQEIQVHLNPNPPAESVDNEDGAAEPQKTTGGRYITEERGKDDRDDEGTDGSPARL